MTELQQLNRLYAMVRAKGVLELEDFYRFTERGVPLAALLGGEMQCSSEEVHAKIIAGTVTAESFLRAINSDAARYWLIQPTNMGDWKLNLTSCPPTPSASTFDWTKSLPRWMRSLMRI